MISTDKEDPIDDLIQRLRAFGIDDIASMLERNAKCLQHLEDYVVSILRRYPVPDELIDSVLDSDDIFLLSAREIVEPGIELRSRGWDEADCELAVNVACAIFEYRDTVRRLRHMENVRLHTSYFQKVRIAIRKWLKK